MKKIVISTFNNSKSNYGALFQSCALSSFLTNMKYDVYNVTVEDRGILHKSNMVKVKRLIKKLLALPRKKLIDERTIKFKRFAVQTQKQLVYRNKQALYDNPPDADVYLSGSDQVWNPVNIHDDFFLCYAGDNAKKISYAASMGNENIPKLNEQKFADYIARYDGISVREDTMIPIIQRYTKKKVSHNIDPVFLMTKEEWAELERPYEKLRFEKYILVYAIEWTAEYNRKLMQLKNMMGLPVVSVNMGNLKKINADQILYNLSPNEFLYLLGRADFVVTTSFHGTAMSIVYHKPFMSFSGSDKPTRIESLLRHFGLDAKDTPAAAVSAIDYVAINRIIVQDREKAREYLIGNIEN